MENPLHHRNAEEFLYRVGKILSLSQRSIAELKTQKSKCSNRRSGWCKVLTERGWNSNYSGWFGGHHKLVLFIVFAMPQHWIAESRNEGFELELHPLVKRNLVVFRVLRIRGYSSGHHHWGSSKTGVGRVVTLPPQELKSFNQHQMLVKLLEILKPYEHVLSTTISQDSIYEPLEGRVWKCSLHCYHLNTHRVYTRCHSVLSYA